VNAVVVDASVVAAALFPEQQSKAARTLFLSGTVLHAPDLIYAEVANVIWKRHRRREISGDEAADLLGDLSALPLEISPSEPLVRPALDLALATGQTVYDCLYVALGVMRKATMISADKRLVNALTRGPLEDCVAWLGTTK
jgi:predicted nucleic acid-binding protein